MIASAKHGQKPKPLINSVVSYILMNVTCKSVVFMLRIGEVNTQKDQHCLDFQGLRIIIWCTTILKVPLCVSKSKDMIGA